MIILGVDPGTLVTGFGVIDAERGTHRVLAVDVIKNAGEQTMPLRLQHIYNRLCDVIEQFHPDEFAIETAFYGKNAQSALKLGHARGVAILAAVNSQIPTTEYSPREVKKSVTGNGAASKGQVQFMVKSQLHLHEVPTLYDATDALAVALCHSYKFHSGKFASIDRKKTSGKTRKNWSTFIQQHPERIVRSK
ncbi:MAG TPA: crossover junction endodeoxyribonuclease RuvC [Bacteroidota bacterium]|nr:crossover junction endodeoxyribonuclease RuvC [Bacteroidota bacterium]